MYGTIARLHVKPGITIEELMAFEQLRNSTGILASYVYRIDEDRDAYFLAMIFQNQDAYQKTLQHFTDDPDYQRLLRLLKSPPLWDEEEFLAPQVAPSEPTSPQ